MTRVALINRRRVTKITGFASTQLAVQVIGFCAGIVLVRTMAQAQYGVYTLAITMVGLANVLTDLGIITAVMALGGRLAGARAPLGHLVADAHALHRRLAWVAMALLVPCFVALLVRQHAPLWQVCALAVTIAVTSLLNVRFGISLSIARLLGNVALQQKLDLVINLGRLVLLMLATSVLLDAVVASVVNVAAALAYFVVLRRFVRANLELPSIAAGSFTAGLKKHVWKQGPNSIYYVFSTQLSVWLIGIFGGAQQVAEVGALGRIAAAFSVVSAVCAALLYPYFARQDRASELNAAFVAVNVFYALLLAALMAVASGFPNALLWVLGPQYDRLQTELVWMVLAATLTSWGGTLYSVGCARGWVLPVWWVIGTGLLATVGAACVVDVSTVRGSFMIGAATGLVSMVVALVYVARQLQLHTRATA
jgi:O-antigen/teichoic acid export membrane protein